MREEPVVIELGWVMNADGEYPHGVQLRVEDKEGKVIGTVLLSRHNFADALASRRAKGIWREYRV